LIFSLIIAVTAIQLTMSPQFCSMCHEMKPEYYTYKASSHQNIKCTDCHIEPGIDKLVIHKVTALKEVYLHVTGTFYSPIKMKHPIKDSICQKCHNMENRSVTPTGDLIIPHAKHANERIACAKCHKGVAHGSIADKSVTFSSDYDKWDESLGQAFMSETKSVSPSMDICMNCHRLRKGPLACKACHTTGMVPVNHKSEEFKNGGHGKNAAKNLYYCDSCHSYMSYEKIEGMEKKPKFQEFLDKGKKNQVPMTVDNYAKVNTFCKNCHSKRPPSHKKDFFLMNHGQEGNVDTKRCMTCHNFTAMSNAPVTALACNSCHPSTHGKDWKKGHYPFPIPPNPVPNQECYKCHNADLCTRCHNRGDNSQVGIKR
jgi:nitrate/TMAO reductase-like tetraheme cytochrome c subunit